MLQGGQVQGQVQTTQAQWRQQQLEMQFDAVSAMEKQQYLAQRNLLLPNPSANWDNKFSSSNTQSRSVGPTPMKSFWQMFPLKKLSRFSMNFIKYFVFS